MNFSYSSTRRVFDHCISILSNIAAKDNDKRLINFLQDITIDRCVLADSDHHKDDRIYMHMNCDRRKEEMHICFSSSCEHLPKKNLFALFVHEIGHLLSLEHPELIDLPEIKIDNMSINGIICDEEIIADYAVEQVFGIRIFYDENKVQVVLMK
jgi:hypothetical protein